MKQIALILFSILSVCSSNAQSLKKYPIGNSGCSAYFLCVPDTFNFQLSPDSSDVYTGECSMEDVTYGIICVKLKIPLNVNSDGEGILISYLDYLKSTYRIKEAAGYGKGHRLKNQEDTRGVIDYWKDVNGLNWKVKGWTNGKYITVMYVCTKNDVPETKANIYLDGLLFPGM